MADLEYDVADGVGTITLNRPALKNAFTFEMIDHWAEALRSARTDPAVRVVVVVTGAGDGFCSGVDLDEFDAKASDPYALNSSLTDRIHRVAFALEDLDKPVIAAVNGVAVGAGLDMALWTGDFVEAPEALRLGLANHVYPDAEFPAAVRALAARLAQQPPINVQMIKRAAYQSSRTDLRTALDLISSHMAVVRSTRDSAEALAAFRERRTPSFEGR